MSILDKYPGPWTHDSDTMQVSDASDGVVACDVTSDVAKLILAAPELLDLARRVAAIGYSGDSETDDVIVSAITLIERIEKGDG